MKIIILTLFATVLLFAQERTNREELKFETTSGTLLKAKSWYYHEPTGEWQECFNVISITCSNTLKKQDSWQISFHDQNFIKLETKAVVFKGLTYYVVIVDKWYGQYKYRNIKEDWFVLKKIIGYIFTKEEYQKPYNIDNLVELKTQNMIYKFSEYNEKSFLDAIQTELSREKSKHSTEYTFPIMKSKEGLIRFYLPENFQTNSKYDFEKKYFETDFENFSKIIIK